MPSYKTSRAARFMGQRPSLMRILIVCPILLLILAVPANGSSCVRMMHNGSRMLVVSSPGGGEGPLKTSISYDVPRQPLRDAGVKAGTPLFEGTEHRDIVEGYAYVFKSGCAPTPYRVEGKWLSTGALVLEGRAPRFRGASCAPLRNDSTSPHASLVFTPVSGALGNCEGP
jgi:hypothetical protein